MFEIKNLCTGYKKEISFGNFFFITNEKNPTKILHENLNFEIKKNNFLGILGMNGTGKSTLLRTIAGILPALSGNILLNNANINTLSLLSLAQQRTLIWSQMPYISHFTVWDWLCTAQYPHIGWQVDLPIEKKDFIQYILEKLNISAWKNYLLHTLSDGEKQKVLIAYSLASENDYLLFDEPTAHLDFLQKSQAFTQFKQLSTYENKGIVVISHEIAHIFNYADTVLWLTEQNSYWYDSPKNLAQNQHFLQYLATKNQKITQFGEKFIFENV